MSKQIIIDKNVLFTQIAIVCEDEMIACYLETSLKSDKQNSIIVGQVEQVVKNLKAVFIDYGDEKNGLLHMKHIPECYQNKLKQGNRLPVQVTKQNTGEKGHKLTSKVNLMGRFLVCLPFETEISISRKIRDLEKRKQLKESIENMSRGKYGFVVRTNAQNATPLQIERDALELIEQADGFMKAKDCLSKGSILYEEPPLFVQLAREAFLENNQEIEIISNQQEVLEFIRCDLVETSNECNLTFKLCNEPEGIFAIYDIEKEKSQLLNRKIWLKNGGNLVIDYTEAMTVVDVNSAKAVVTKNPQKAVLELNLLAVKETILQILRRNLSGMILVDLVEMPFAPDKQKVYEYAKELLIKYQDKRTKVYPLTELGLLQFSRSKKYTSIPEQLIGSCPHCNLPFGNKNFNYYMAELEKKIKEIKERTEHKVIFVEAEEEFIDFLSKNDCIDKLENYYMIKIHLKKSTGSLKKMFLCQFYQR